jgi:hypothetical protein
MKKQYVCLANGCYNDSSESLPIRIEELVLKIKGRCTYKF